MNGIERIIFLLMSYNIVTYHFCLSSMQHVLSEPFEPSPFIPARGSDNEFDAVTSRQQQGQADNNIRSAAIEKEIVPKDSNVAKIKVVVREVNFLLDCFAAGISALSNLHDQVIT